MIQLIHGDNQVQSREHLNRLIDQIKNTGIKDTIRLEAKSLTQLDLIQALETQSFFGTDKLVIIEGILSLPKSATKNSLIKYLSKTLTKSNLPHIIIWEPKTLTPTQIKPLGPVKQTSFPINKVLFKFLDSIGQTSSPSLLQLYTQATTQESPELVFAMLIRQLRLLIQVKFNEASKLAPWQRQKLFHQSQAFTEEQLLKLHQKLLEIDRQHKTGQSLTSFKASLDFLILNL